MIAGQVFLAQHRNMVISAVHGRPHQVDAAGVQTDEFLMRMLDVQHLPDQQIVRARHKAAHFGIDGHVRHAGRSEDAVVDLLHLCTDDLDIVWRLIRSVRDAHAAGQVDERDIHPGLVPQFDRQFEQLACQRRVVIVRHRVAGQERVDAAVLHALFLQQPHPFEHLLRRKAVFRFARIVHDRRIDRKAPARIVPHAYGSGQFADGLFAVFDVGDIVEIDDGADLGGVLEFRRRRHVRREHDLIAGQFHRLREGKLRSGRAVAAKTVFLQDAHDERIRAGLDREEFPVTRIPGESFFDPLAVFPQTLLIVQMERRRILFDDLFDLRFCYERFLFHDLLLTETPCRRG